MPIPALPPKFRSQVLNYYPFGPLGRLHDDLVETFKEKTVSSWIFWTQTVPPESRTLGNKDHIRTYKDFPGYIIKAAREDLPVASDAHIYRVRKARRIQQIIDREGWQRHVVVPKKYLFYHNEGRKWLVVAEKLPIYSSSRLTMSPKQAKAIATIAIETGMTDLHTDNVVKTTDGRIAIIDTEPVARVLMKSFRSSFFYRWGFLDIDAFKLLLSLTGLDHLNRYCNIRKEIKGVRQYYAAKRAAILCGKALLQSAAYYATKWIPQPIIQRPLRLFLGMLVTAKVAQALFLLYKA